MARANPSVGEIFRYMCGRKHRFGHKHRVTREFVYDDTGGIDVFKGLPTVSNKASAEACKSVKEQIRTKGNKMKAVAHVHYRKGGEIKFNSK